MESKKILATNGHTILVDADDYPFLNRYTWYVLKNKAMVGYARTNIFINGKKITIPMHRLIMGMRTKIVDHQNRNTLDNRKQNLRFCSASQNQLNRVRPNKTGFKGVQQPPDFKRYFAKIGYKNKIYFSKLCDTAEQAAKEYDKLAIKHHGVFAVLNFPKDNK